MIEFLLAAGKNRTEFRPGAIVTEYLWKTPILFRPGAIVSEYLYRNPTTFRPGAVVAEYLYITNP